MWNTHWHINIIQFSMLKRVTITYLDERNVYHVKESEYCVLDERNVYHVETSDYCVLRWKECLYSWWYLLEDITFLSDFSSFSLLFQVLITVSTFKCKLNIKINKYINFPFLREVEHSIAHIGRNLFHTTQVLYKNCRTFSDQHHERDVIGQIRSTFKTP